jgi:hypothetical protein
MEQYIRLDSKSVFPGMYEFILDCGQHQLQVVSIQCKDPKAIVELTDGHHVLANVPLEYIGCSSLLPATYVLPPWTIPRCLLAEPCAVRVYSQCAPRLLVKSRSLDKWEMASLQTKTLQTRVCRALGNSIRFQVQVPQISGFIIRTQLREDTWIRVQIDHDIRTYDSWQLLDYVVQRIGHTMEVEMYVPWNDQPQTYRISEPLQVQIVCKGALCTIWSATDYQWHVDRQSIHPVCKLCDV